MNKDFTDKPMFDPDAFNLSKKQIFQVMDAIGSRWGKSKMAKFHNAQYIIGLEAIKVGITLTKEEVIQQIWNDILIGFNELIRLNQLERMRNEFPDMGKMVDLVTAKIESGELFGNTK